MDFNYLYHRQQVSLMRADAAASPPAKAAHERLAELYTGLIADGKAERQFGFDGVSAGPVLP
ncbi:MAG TPA: hypothetical protein VF631_05375 [Allosphingosinicella sp.]|uniref:hypothetical protein n=1 Tax=Allosphingosinicella sp. TaxID=2823234 RepID=UPI002F2A7656